MKLSVDRALNKARLAFKKGDISQATQLCNEVLAAYPGNLRAQAALNSLKNAGQSGSRAAKSAPQTQLKALISLFNQNRLDQVIEMGEKLAPTSTQSFIVYNILGAANSRLNRAEKAIECFARAVQIKPDYSDAHTNLGNTLAQTGRRDEAIASYQKALQFKPEDADVHNNLGVVLKDLGRHSEAVECLTRAVKLNPAYAAAFFNLGVAQEHLGRHEEAIDSLQRSIQLNPNHAPAHNSLGIILHQLGRYEEAIDSFAQALEHKPDDIDLCLRQGTVLKDANRLDEAADCFSKVLQVRPDDPDTHNNLGNLILRLDGFDNAKQHFRSALALDPDHKPALLNLCVCCVNSGDFSAANELLSRLYQLRPDAIGVVRLLFKLPQDMVNLDFHAAIDRCRVQDNQTEQDCENEKLFMRAAVLDREGRHKEAWQTAKSANAAVHPEHADAFKTEADSWIKELEAVRQFDPKRINQPADKARADGIVPIFILGPSRAGKTTLETLVSGDHRIKRGYENSVVEAAAVRASLAADLGTIRSISNLPVSLLGSFAEGFRQRVENCSKDKKAITITNPGHVGGVGRLAEALPEARFVFLTRDLDDTALRIFMNSYAAGNHYAYHIDTVYQYVEWYEDVTKALVAKLADRCLHLRYEDMVSEPTASVEGVLKLCGLSAENVTLPDVGADVGAAGPYIDFIRGIRQ